MSTPATAPSNPPPAVPPEEHFWKRYSPHHEFPLSSVVSAAFYIVLAVGLYVSFHYLYDWLFPNKEALPVEAITLDAGGAGGSGDTGDPKEAIPEEQDRLPDKYKPSVPLTTLERPAVNPEVAQDFDPKDADVKRYIEEKNLPVAAFSGLAKNARQKLLAGLRKPGGTGTSNGDGPGPGGKFLNERQKRVLRWTMTFDTVNGDDYRRQLSALGAILGVPGPNGHLVIRDLKHRPASGKVEDLNQIKRIFWIDNRPDSVGPLARALGLKEVPNHVVAFFPEKIETELLRKELKFKGRKEHQIQETRFRVVRRGATYEPIVIDQTPVR